MDQSKIDQLQEELVDKTKEAHRRASEAIREAESQFTQQVESEKNNNS